MLVHPAPGATLIRGDCVETLRRFGAARFDAIVTDPPYELGFMGKAWDASGIAYSVDLWRECLRVLKPGGHLLAFGATRTYHRMTCAIEDSGFEIRDSLHWIYGTGFPKSLNVSKAIDAAAGAEREVLEVRGTKPSGLSDSGFTSRIPNVITAAATDAARQWEGWGTALKPAHEPIVMARKPLEGTVAANVLAHGTGAINVDACRIEGAKPATGRGAGGVNGRYSPPGTPGVVERIEDDGRGRWPANVLLGEVAAAELDAQSGTLKSGNLLPGHKRGAGVTSIHGGGGTVRAAYGGDSGGASRFFYVAKPSRTERDRGCEHLPKRSGGEATDRADDSAGVQNPHAGANRGGGAANYHPTVKPIDLMRYLVRLVTPPGGVVLDPFTGSGTTGIAARLEGFGFLGIERDPEYLKIASARIAA